MTLEVFDTTLHKTYAWLRELMEVMAWEDRHRAYLALRATLHALRDRLTIEEVAQLSAQLPMLIRGIYFEGWDPTGKPLKERDADQFLLRIEEQFGKNGVDPEQVARGVFRVLATRVSEGEIEDVKQVLPKSLRALWPDLAPREAAAPRDTTGVPGTEARH